MTYLVMGLDNEKMIIFVRKINEYFLQEISNKSSTFAKNQINIVLLQC